MDVVEAVMAILAADSHVTAQTSLIYDTDIALPEDVNMPAKVVVVRRAGGAPRFAQGTLQLLDPRINTISYGETQHIAQNVDTAVYYALRNVGPGVWFNTYIHWCKPTTLGLPLRDPDTQWPYVVSSWEVLVSDQPIAA